jgi:hypothetical protein
MASFVVDCVPSFRLSEDNKQKSRYLPECFHFLHNHRTEYILKLVLPAIIVMLLASLQNERSKDPH